MPDIGTMFRVGEVLKKSIQAGAVFSQSNQENTDKIVRAIYLSVMENRVKLAKLAVEETGLGYWKDKVLKTVVASQFLYEYLKDRKTVGVISSNVEKGITEIANPIGTVLGIVSKTDPIASAVFKIIIAMKTRNPIILAPHEKTVKITKEICRICYDAALKENAPEDCIQIFYTTDSDEFAQLTSDKRLALIIGIGAETVKDKANLGAPLIGSGTGNVPVYVTKTIDPDFAAKQIIDSKNFDRGVMGSSEQSIVIDKEIAAAFKVSMKNRGAYFVDSRERELLVKFIFDKNGVMNDDIVGQKSYDIAAKAGFEVPADTTLLVVSLYGVGREFPLSAKILAPIISYNEVNTFDEAVNMCIDLNYYGGIGHTVCIYSTDNEKIDLFSEQMAAGRILVNTPSSMGAMGGIYNLLPPSFSLACGSAGRTTTMDNVSIKHLISLQRITRRRVDRRLKDFDKSFYFDESVDVETIEKLFNKNY
jgi:acetaldehyde dehydrogenase / alcohol dehydrogenase